jgi:hypothetical protein
MRLFKVLGSGKISHRFFSLFVQIAHFINKLHMVVCRLTDISSANSSPTMRPAASAPCSRLPFSLLKCANSTFCLEDDHRTCVSGAINVPSDNSSSRTRTYLLAARHNAAYALQQIDSLSLTWQVRLDFRMGLNANACLIIMLKK